jgi:hypothetical protein
MTAEYGYPRSEIGKDYLRALIGLAVCAAPFLWVWPATFVIVLLACMAFLFLILLAQTAYRHAQRIVVDDEGITVHAVLRRRIPWNQLQQLQLSYFTTWKNVKGFMELKLKGGGTTIRIGSNLRDFNDVVRVASAAAGRNRLQFSAATIDNLRHLALPDPRPLSDPSGG